MFGSLKLILSPIVDFHFLGPVTSRTSRRRIELGSAPYDPAELDRSQTAAGISRRVKVDWRRVRLSKATSAIRSSTRSMPRVVYRKPGDRLVSIVGRSDEIVAPNLPRDLPAHRLGVEPNMSVTSSVSTASTSTDSRSSSTPAAQCRRCGLRRRCRWAHSPGSSRPHWPDRRPAPPWTLNPCSLECVDIRSSRYGTAQPSDGQQRLQSSANQMIR